MDHVIRKLIIQARYTSVLTDLMCAFKREVMEEVKYNTSLELHKKIFIAKHMRQRRVTFYKPPNVTL